MRIFDPDDPAADRPLTREERDAQEEQDRRFAERRDGRATPEEK